MTDLWEPFVAQDLLRPECQRDVIDLLRQSDLSPARKRALYLRWLLRVKMPYHAEDLDAVIADQEIGSPAPRPSR